MTFADGLRAAAEICDREISNYPPETADAINEVLGAPLGGGRRELCIKLRDAIRAAIPAQPKAEGLAEEPCEILASRLIDAWCADKGKQIPWAKAVQIVAIITKQPDAERDRLLQMGDLEDGSCGMCGRSDAAPAAPQAATEG